MPTARTHSPDGPGSDELVRILERVLAPIEDLVDVMGVPVDVLEAAGELPGSSADGDTRVPESSEPWMETAEGPMATPPTPLVVRDSVARKGGRVDVHVGEGPTLEIAIPAGVVTGDLLRVSPGDAAQGRETDDLLLQVLVLPKKSVVPDSSTLVDERKRFRRRRLR
jgi:hypothetical protein